MKRLILLGVAICMSCVLALAAPDKVSNCYGRVVDEQGEPLIGAMVTVPGTRIGTTTDIDGNFQLKAPVDAVIKVTYVGYTSDEKRARGNVGDIVLKPEVNTSMMWL